MNDHLDAKLDLGKNQRLERFIFSVLVGLVAILPLVTRERLIMTLGIVMLLLGASVFGLGRRLILNRQIYLILGFLALVSVATWFSIQREVSIFASTGSDKLWLPAPAYAILAATYFFALQVNWDPPRIRALVLATVCVVAGLSIFALAVFTHKYLQTGVILSADKAHAFFSNPNRFAFFLTAVFPLALRLFLQSKTEIVKKVVFGACCLVILAADIITFSRTAWIVSVMVLFAVLLSVKKKKAALALAIVMLGVVLLMVGTRADARFDFKSYASNRFASIFQASSLDSRLGMWRAAKNLTMDRPLTGYGPNTFALVGVRYESMTMAAFKSKPSSPHNFPLMVSSALGLPALVLLMLIIFGAIKTAMASQDYLKQTLGLSMLTMVLLSQTLLWHPESMVAFWLFMGVSAQDKFLLRGSKVIVLKAVLAVGAVLITAWLGLLVTADAYYDRSLVVSDREQARQYLKKAIAIDPYAYRYWNTLFGKVKEKPYSERLAIIRQAHRNFPLSEEPLYMEARLRYMQRNEASHALSLLDRALKIRPYYIDARLLKAKILSRQGRSQEAAEELGVVKEISLTGR